MLAVSPAVRYLLGAVLAVLIGYLADAYLPLGPVAHILAILCYIAAAVLVVLALFALLSGVAPRGPHDPTP